MQYPCSVLDFGAEEIEFYTLHYPQSIGQNWEVERPLHKELAAVRRCMPDRILFLDASDTVLRARKEADATRSREFFDHYITHMLPLKRAWFAQKDNVDWLSVDTLHTGTGWPQRTGLVLGLPPPGRMIPPALCNSAIPASDRMRGFFSAFIPALKRLQRVRMCPASAYIPGNRRKISVFSPAGQIKSAQKAASVIFVFAQKYHLLLDYFAWMCHTKATVTFPKPFPAFQRNAGA